MAVILLMVISFCMPESLDLAMFISYMRFNFTVHPNVWYCFRFWWQDLSSWALSKDKFSVSAKIPYFVKLPVFVIVSRLVYHHKEKMTIEVNTTPVVLFVQQSVIVWWFIFAANLGAIHITLVRKPQSHTCGFAPDLYVTITQPSFPLLFLAPCSLPLPPCSLASLAPFPCFFTLLCAPFPCPFPMLLASCSFSIFFWMFGNYRACCKY